MNIFYSTEMNADGLYQLSEEESRHCTKVLRYRKGDEIILVDGLGNYIEGIIENDNPRGCTVSVKSIIRNFKKRNYQLHVAIAPTKNIDRFEWFLEKATETGINEITPIICEHSERRKIKIDRLNKVLVSAMKQSVNAYLPKLNSYLLFKNFVFSEIPPEKYICNSNAPKDALFKNKYERNKNATVLIGPEGDFSTHEIQMATENNFIQVNLGESRLRTETAGVHVCSIINFINS